MIIYINQLAEILGKTTGCSKEFLGLKPWYNYLEAGDNCGVKHFNVLPPNSDVPLVLLAVVDDLLRIAGMVAVAFVIASAVKFMTSDGQPDKIAAARQTILNALIGLAIALVAIVFVSFLGSRLT